jgi:5-hydroxyisourate hydrolase-like protein (transthyretin family)
MATSHPITGIPTVQTLVFTGTVYDMTTSGLGINLSVTLCNCESTIEEIKTSVTDAEGNFYISLNSNEFTLGAGALFTFAVRQYGNLLNIETPDGSIPYLHVSNMGEQHLVDLRVHTLQTLRKVTGTVKLKSGKPAPYVKVELLPFNEQQPIADGFTNAQGFYELHYDVASYLASTPKMLPLMVKFYNKEDIITDSSSPNQVMWLPNWSKLISSAGYQSGRNQTYTIKPFPNDIKKVVVNGNSLYYKIESVTQNGATWIAVEKLTFVKEITVNDKVELWRVESNSLHLMKRIKYSGSNGKSRDTYMRATYVNGAYVPATYYERINLPTGEELLMGEDTQGSPPNERPFIYYQEKYRPSSSPRFTSALINTLNFKFTKDSLDLYTKLTTGLTELTNFNE